MPIQPTATTFKLDFPTSTGKGLTKMLAFTFECEVPVNRILVLNLPASVLPGKHQIEVVVDPNESSSAIETMEALVPVSDEVPPRTELWQRLIALRAQAEANGMSLLSQDEILAEMRQRRGEDE
ncbi:hypothetical protein BN874_130012 [Candidatus Contendobacter odensis Run_B_J11]|uniref:Uncharacterized protein n=2 Tax=Candidatus Contendibacter odensensis TaxID=1400860 RepID=A0A7U7J1N7_9GAMM|nr:hypothetical protein BN874_130012 [Candidatus Contendobacter odensis Run_B_J11]